MKVSSVLLSPGGAALVLLAVLGITSAAKDKDKHQQHRAQQREESLGEQEQIRGAQEAFHANYHKVVGVDFRTDGHSIDYQHRVDDQAVEIEEDKEEEGHQAEGQVRSEMRGQRAGSDRCLVFNDEFDRLDNSVWKHDLTLTGGGNYEFQLYHNNRTNTFVKDGIFYIKPTLTENRIGANNLRESGVLDMWGTDPGTRCTGNYDYGCFRVAGAGGNMLNPVQSGMVRSVDAFKFRYGKVVVRAKMPKGKWIWPAIWMLPAHYQYGNWPASGEIDLVESRGNGPEYPGGGHDKIASTLHWGPSYEFNRFTMTHAEHALPAGETFADEFHIFTLDWTSKGIKTYVDDHLVLDVPFNNMYQKGKFPAWVDNLWAGSDAAPFDQEFYLLMNVAVGGTAGYFPDGVGGKPWSDRSEHAVNEFYSAKDDWYPTWGSEKDNDRAMAVDYIRVYRANCA